MTSFSEEGVAAWLGERVLNGQNIDDVIYGRPLIDSHLLTLQSHHTLLVLPLSGTRLLFH